jgi:triosephosphate isomerase
MRTHNKRLSELSQYAHIVICPPSIQLSDACNWYRNMSISVGSQNCSQYSLGAYTGEIDAQSLKEIGCSYSIVGHSERRRLFHESNNDILHKINQLLAQSIVPIWCIGETAEEYSKDKALLVLAEQLRIFSSFINPFNIPIMIAYEPVWAIGTGIIPDHNHLEKVFNDIRTYSQELNGNTILLYGGSVDENSIKMIKDVTGVEGYLIGSASVDFEKFEKIVLLGK